MINQADLEIRLRWALAATGLAILPHLLNLPAWISAMIVSVLAWRLLASFLGWSLPPRPLRLALAVAAVVGVFFTFGRLNGLNAGSALILSMLAMKLLETSRPRDLVVLILISYFLIVVNFLYTQGIPALLYSLPTLWVITIALLQVSGTRRALTPVAAGRFTGRVLLQALPLMALLFLLFPRVPGPLWGLPARSDALSGLDEEMSPGTITRLSLSDEIAFTARFSGAAPAPDDLYWRGPVLHQFDGRTWRRGWRNYQIESGFDFSGIPWQYEITLEPHNRRWLFALDVPGALPSGTRMRFDFQLVSQIPVTTLKRYSVMSYRDHRLDPQPGPHLLEYARDLPDEKNPRTRAFAQSLLAQSSDNSDLVRRVLAHFTRQPYIYTLQPPELSGAHPVDHFLFETRAGFCEHFASAFATLMRAAGIPARVVTGYLGGERNPLTGHLTVRQSDAHAWTEVWLDDSGWRRVDPTAAVAPERVRTGLAGSMGAGEPVPGLFMRSNRWLNRVRFSFDALNGMWNGFILGYGPDAQSALLSRLGFRFADWRTLTALLALAVSGVAALLALVILRQRPARRKDPAQQLYDTFCRRMARRAGLTRLPAESPAAFASRCAILRPDLAARIASITDCYLQARYAPGDPGVPLAHMRARLTHFRP